MSQKKTVIPGLEPSKDPNFSPFSADPSFYSRSANAQKGTVVSGFGNFSGNNAKEAPPHQPAQQQTGKPVVGFLYSISRTAVGEYWPLHLGPNTIGQSSDCDIVLREGTVSAHHAEIIIRKLKNPVKTIASIKDSRSTNGTMINGESLDLYEPRKCSSGNIITIGDNYQLLFILIDTNEFGLSESKNFIHIANEDADAFIGEESAEPGNTRSFMGFTGPAQEMYQGSKPTVGLNGTLGTEPGGTVGM